MALLIFLNAGFTYGVYLLITYLLIVSNYRLFLHPLKDYPGPLAAKVSSWYGAYYAWLSRLHLRTRHDHLRYGPVIRYGPNRLIFNSAKALHDIYDSDRVEKSKVYLTSLLSPHPNIFNVIEDQAHRTKRKLIGNVLSERSMRAFEPTMLEQVDVFIEQIRLFAQTSSPVNISDQSKYLALDVVGHLAFGYSLNLQRDPANRHMISTIEGANHRMNIYMQYPLLASLQLLRKIIESRLGEEKHAKHDMYSIVVDTMTKSEGEILALSEIWSEALFFVPAGGETITAAISGLFFYLSRNPRCYRKLAEEIRSTFETCDDIRGGPKLSGCQYLRACIDEALRLSPPAPGTLWRERSAADDKKEPLVIDGHVIPEGVTFGVNIYTLHHNDEYFPDPFAYKPERWLPSYTSEEQRKTMYNAFAAFQIGSRGCAGKAMAYLEVSLVIAKTLWHFDFQKAPGKIGELGGGTGSPKEINGRERKDEYQLEDIFTTRHDGPNLTFSLRSEVT